MDGDRKENYEFYRSLRDTLYGKVRYGQDKRTKTYVIIKEYYLELVKARKSVHGVPLAEDAMAEVKTHQFLNKGNHPHIVGIYDVFRDARKMYVVLEFCKNGDFFNAVQNKEKFPESVCKKYFKQLLEGVFYMHSKGYAHRDLSLENILMDEKENLKICDFGQALECKEGQQIPVDGTRPGKMHYMCPEIYNKQKYSPFSADLYSCGVMLFIMLIGTFPYNIPDETDERFKMIVGGELNGLLKLWGLEKSISDAAKDLLSKLITYESKRLTLKDIVKHEWLSKTHRAVDEKKSKKIQPPDWFSRVNGKMQALIIKSIQTVLEQYFKQPSQQLITNLIANLQRDYKGMNEKMASEIVNFVYLHLKQRR